MLNNKIKSSFLKLSQEDKNALLALKEFAKQMKDSGEQTALCEIYMKIPLHTFMRKKVINEIVKSFCQNFAKHENMKKILLTQFSDRTTNSYEEFIKRRNNDTSYSVLESVL